MVGLRVLTVFAFLLQCSFVVSEAHAGPEWPELGCSVEFVQGKLPRCVQAFGGGKNELGCAVCQYGCEQYCQRGCGLLEVVGQEAGEENAGVGFEGRDQSCVSACRAETEVACGFSLGEKELELLFGF